MTRAVLLGLLLSSVPAPSAATFRNVTANARASIVTLRCKNGRAAPAVIIGGNGELLTSSRACADRAVRAELGEAKTLTPLTILREDTSLGVWLLQLPAGPTYSAAPVARSLPPDDAWIVAVGVSAKGISSSSGMVHGRDPESDAHLLADAPTELGAAIFSLDGKLVGIAVQPAPRHQVRVAPIDALRAWLTSKP